MSVIYDDSVHFVLSWLMKAKGRVHDCPKTMKMKIYRIILL